MATKTIHFGSSFTCDARSYSLIQLPDEVMKQIESNPGMTLKLVGHDNEEVVLLTEEKTYAVRRGETSNMQLLFSCPMQELLDTCSESAAEPGTLDESISTLEAVANVQTHFEVSELAVTPPRLKLLPSLLNRRPYEGPDYEEEECSENERRLSRDQLGRMLQASTKEVDDELQRLGALFVDGCYCLLAPHYESNLMHSFFAAAAVHSWDLSNIAFDKMIQDKDLAKFPHFILRNFLFKYAKRGTDTTKQSEGGDVPMHSAEEGTCLDLKMMALFRADELLKALTSSNKLTVEEFIQAWGAMLPSMKLDMDLLWGRAITEQRGAQTFVKNFNVSTLSAEHKVRFKQLFQAKSSWRREEILPYIEDLIGDADQLLLKHTRVTRLPVPGKPNEELKMYSSRV